MKYQTKTKTRTARPSTKPKRGRHVEDDDDEDDDFEDDDDDDDFEEDRPKRSKKSSSSKKRRSSRDDDDDDEEDEDDAPGIEGGWGAYNKNKAETSTFPGQVKLSKDPQLFVFLDKAPLASVKQHWIERKGKKSFVCLEDDCPLCNIGDPVKVQNAFNVVRLDDGTPMNMLLVCGIKLTDIFVSKTSEKMPLNKGYWSIARTGKGGNTNFDVSRVKERDLEEDFEVEPLEDSAVEKLRKKVWAAKDAFQRTPRKELKEIAKGQVGEYDDDDDDE